MKPLHCLAIAAVAASMGYARPAFAVYDLMNAVDVCQGSLPSFEGALRKRPLAIKNEGAITAFVSCSLRTPVDTDVTPYVYVTNRNAGPKTVSCTLVDGIALPFANLPPKYWPAEQEVPAGENAILTWSSDGNGQLLSTSIPNLNCALPPGVEINVLGVTDDF